MKKDKPADTTIFGRDVPKPIVRGLTFIADILLFLCRILVVPLVPFIALYSIRYGAEETFWRRFLANYKKLADLFFNIITTVGV